MMTVRHVLAVAILLLGAIPAAAQARLFERFNQADVSTTRRFGGSGLGLAITRHLLLAMKGDIGVDSQAGVGSVFTASLPLAAAGFETYRYRKE